LVAAMPRCALCGLVVVLGEHSSEEKYRGGWVGGIWFRNGKKGFNISLFQVTWTLLPMDFMISSAPTTRDSINS
jgi:hypothetical protein